MANNRFKQNKLWGLGLHWAWLPLAGFVAGFALIFVLLIIWLAQGKYLIPKTTTCEDTVSESALVESRRQLSAPSACHEPATDPSSRPAACCNKSPLRFARVVYPLWRGSLSRLPRPCCCCAEPLFALQITQDT